MCRTRPRRGPRSVPLSNIPVEAVAALREFLLRTDPAKLTQRRVLEAAMYVLYTSRLTAVRGEARGRPTRPASSHPTYEISRGAPLQAPATYSAAFALIWQATGRFPHLTVTRFGEIMEEGAGVVPGSPNPPGPSI